MPVDTAAPRTELGSIQQFGALPGWGVFIDLLEHNPKLLWPQALRVWEDMLADAQVQALRMATTLPLRRRRWLIDPNGSDPRIVDHVASDFGLPVKGQKDQLRRPLSGRFSWGRHLEHVLRAPLMGHYFFEIVGEIQADGLWHLRKLAPRPPKSIYEIDVDLDGGLKAIRQAGALQPIEIPAERLVGYVWDQEGAQWTGRSELRSIYKHWLAKDYLMRADVTKHQRNGMGVPVVESAPGSSQAQIDQDQQLASSVRGGDVAGVAMPAGAKLRLVGVEGSLPDTVASIRYHDEQMARAFLAMFIQLGQTATGSRALGERFVDFFALSLDARAEWVCEVTNEFAIERFVRWNFGETDTVPLLISERNEDEEASVQDLATLVQQGLLVVDDDIRTWVRDRVSAPQPPEGAAQPSPPAVPAGPQATARGAKTRRPAAAATGDVGHRQPSAVEQQAGVDFEQLQADRQAAAEQLASDWAAVTQAQIDELVLQVAAASTPAELAQLTVQTTGQAALAAAMVAMAAQGAQSAIDEAAAQGHTLAAPAAADFTDRAEALSLMVGQQLAQSATAAALAATGTSQEIATAVRDHLEGLAGAALGQELDNAMHEAQSLGRMDAMEGWGTAARFYGSELLDVNTCDPCRAEDETEYATLAQARADYPLGAYVGCEGGRRCRGTVVAVASEAA